MSSHRALDELERRTFQSLMLTTRVRTMEARGQLVAEVDIPMATQLLGKFEVFVPGSILRRLETVSKAFAIFYCFENMARTLVMQRLIETKESIWWDSVPLNVQRRVSGQKDHAKKNQWHEVQADSDMDYTLFSDLFSIISSNWEEFKDLFPDVAWVKTRLEELEKSRNAIMHGRMLAPTEIVRLEQYFDDWIDQVGG
jgi:hypothetical protein